MIKKNMDEAKKGFIKQLGGIAFKKVSENTYEIIWKQKTYNNMGKVTGVKRYSGVFTLAQAPVSNNLQQLLVNPFGLRIIYFSTTLLGSVT